MNIFTERSTPSPVGSSQVIWVAFTESVTLALMKGILMVMMMMMMIMMMMVMMMMMMMITTVVALKVLKKCVGELGIIFIGAIHTF